MLVTIHNNTPVVSHRIIAANTDNQQKNIAELISNYRDKFEAIAPLSVLNEGVVNNGKGEQPKSYMLNEQQASFLMTLLRNSEKVVEFKFALVKAFYELKEQAKQSPAQNIQTAIEYAGRRKILDTRQRVDPQDPLIREALYVAHGGKCFYTGATLERDRFHIDHIQPKSKGGADALYNLVLCDPTINRQKGDWLDHSWIVSKQLFNEQTHAMIAGRWYNDKVYIDSMSNFREQILSNAAMVQLLCKLLGERVMRRIMSAALGIDDTQLYALSSVDGFIKERVRLHGDARVRLSDMYAAYAAWCKEAGAVAMFARDFERKLKESKLLSVKRARESKGDKYTLVTFVLGGEI